MKGSPFAGNPAIAAACEVRPGRYPELDALEMYERVLHEFLSKWRLDPSMVDGLLAAPAGMASGQSDIFIHETLADYLGTPSDFL